MTDHVPAISHGFTEHGHPCCGLAPSEPRPSSVARCGGSRMCPACQRAAGQIHGTTDQTTAAPTAGPSNQPAVLNIHHLALQEIDRVVGNELTLDEHDTTRIRSILAAALSEAYLRSSASTGHGPHTTPSRPQSSVPGPIMQETRGSVPEDVIRAVAAGVDPVDPEEAAANPSLRAAADIAYRAGLRAGSATQPIITDAEVVAGDDQPTTAIYQRAREAARDALNDEPVLTDPGHLVRRRIVDAAVESIWHAVRLVGGTTRTIAITDAAVRAAAASIWGEGMGGEDIAREALKAALPHLLGGNSTVTVDLKTQLVDAMIAMQTLYDTLINGPDITNHDARYIQLSNQPVDHTVSHGNRVLVDLDVDGKPVGIEIIGLNTA